MKPLQWRGLDFFNPDIAHPNVLIIGCGHIGSYLAFGVARMGVKSITVVDQDMVEPHNLPNQFFGETLVKDLSDEPTLFKVVALQQTIKWMMPSVEIQVIPTRIEAADIKFDNYGCIMVAVDDMNVRKWIWSQLELATKPKLLIDARTGGQFANIFGIVLVNDVSRSIYKENLYDNSEVPELPCTGTSIIDVSFAVVADCLQKYRQYVKRRSIVGIHTFHDGITGTTSLMRIREFHSDTKRTIDTPGLESGDRVASPVEATDG